MSFFPSYLIVVLVGQQAVGVAGEGEVARVRAVPVVCRVLTGWHDVDEVGRHAERHRVGDERSDLCEREPEDVDDRHQRRRRLLVIQLPRRLLDGVRRRLLD